MRSEKIMPTTIQPALPVMHSQECDSLADAALRVLLVEDNAPSLQLISDLLTDFGCHVQACVHAEDALLHMAQTSFDLLLSDISLPGMSGVALAQKIRMQYPQMPIILASGHALSMPLYSLQACYYLAKPFGTEQLRILLLSIHASMNKKR